VFRKKEFLLTSKKLLYLRIHTITLIPLPSDTYNLYVNLKGGICLVLLLRRQNLSYLKLIYIQINQKCLCVSQSLFKRVNIVVIRSK